jgi:hypothetical protein
MLSRQITKDLKEAQDFVMAVSLRIGDWVNTKSLMSRYDSGRNYLQ